jgi:dTDP-4-dehydrorhamnose 3,5-epimerase
MATAESNLALPRGMRLLSLTSHPDARGTFTEIFRNQWDLGPQPVQWSMVQSGANVMRGVHVHWAHWDYLLVVQGEMLLGVRDLRTDSATFGSALLLRLAADDPHLAIVPPGIAHGFYYAQPATHVYAMSEYHDVKGERGCRWDDPDLGLAWPCTDPVLSDRDRTAGTLAAVMAEGRTDGHG